MPAGGKPYPPGHPLADTNGRRKRRRQVAFMDPKENRKAMAKLRKRRKTLAEGE